MVERWQIESLDRQRHDRTSFDCGKPSLNRWLAEFANQFEQRNLARTYVAVSKGEKVVRGYYSVSSHHVAYEALPDTHSKELPRRQSSPVVLLGKLAVCKSAQGTGLGRLLLIDALRLTEHISQEIGARAVEVDAIDEKARGFYLKFGFTELLDNPLHLYLPLKAIKKLRLPTWRGD